VLLLFSVISAVPVPFPVSLQITAARHAIKTDCGVGVAAVGNLCYGG
jgi:hypothetical protein